MLEALRTWGTFTVLGPLKGGHRNKVIKVQSDDGVFVAKSSRRSEAALHWLDPVFDMAKAAGFRVPRLIRNKYGRVIEAGWTLEPFLAGKPAKDNLALITPMMARFHMLARTLEQRPGFACAHELLIKDISGDIDLGIMPTKLVAQLRAAWQGLPKAQTIIHADLCAGNVLIRPNARPALIDWDEARRDTVIFDRDDGQHTRAKLAWEIAACWQVEPARANRLSAHFETNFSAG